MKSKWVQERNGVPPRVKGTNKTDDEDVLRLHFPEKSEDDDQFEKIEWNDFFRMPDENNLDYFTRKQRKTARRVPSISS